jgi:NAD+ diphosphatase
MSYFPSDAAVAAAPVVATRDNPFVGVGRDLNRHSERRDDTAWLDTLARSPGARYLILDDALRAYLTHDGAGLRWLDATQRAEWLPADLPVSFLGVADGAGYFVAQLDAARAIPPDQLAARIEDLRQASARLPAFDAGLFAYAKGLLHWQQATRFCCRCGSSLALGQGGHRLQCVAPDCAQLHFVRTDPAVITLVEHDGACLLGRHAHWAPGLYSLIAGFVEPGESLEEAVRREVAEETGVRVGAVSYHSSQPWPMPASLMLGFSAVALGREMAARDQELEDVRWFTPAEIVAGLRDGTLSMPTPLSVSYRIIADWLRQRAALDLDALRAASR